MTRQEINLKILKLLLVANELMPDQRFRQLLINLQINQSTGSFYEESQETYERLEKRFYELLSSQTK